MIRTIYKSVANVQRQSVDFRASIYNLLVYFVVFLTGLFLSFDSFIIMEM